MTNPNETPLSDLSAIDSPQDAQLWQRVIAGDQQAFEAVVVRFQNRISAVAFAQTGNFDWAQEITQETFWQAWRGRSDLRDPSQLGPWLCGIARNLSRQLLRREIKHRSSDLQIEWNSDLDDPALINVSREENETVWNALEQLNENYREPLVLYYRQEHSVADVAEVLGISEDAVKQRLTRGRSLLRDRLADQVEEVLLRSRPNRQLTHRIMAGIAALATSLKVSGSTATATAASTAAATVIGKQVASGVAAKSIFSAAIGSGLLGGLIGILGGLGGGWIGTWLPAQMAETIAQKELLERRGKTAFRVSVGFTLAMLLPSVMLLFPISQLWFALVAVIVSLVFVVFIIEYSLETNAQLEELKRNDNSPKNLSRVKSTLERFQSTQGRSYTSHLKLLGIPLLDIQLSGSRLPMDVDAKVAFTRKKAVGWIAIGDDALGILLAFGGIAKGCIAFGGLAVGGIAFGGCAIGGIALGGGAIGLVAIGGGALGYHAAGGGAIGFRSAVGGGAIAYHVAVGGGAYAVEHTINGASIKDNSNPHWLAAQQDSLLWMLEWQQQHPYVFVVFMMGIIGIPVLFSFVLIHFVSANNDAPDPFQK